MAMASDRVIHGLVQHFLFRAFEFQRAATLARVLAAIDRFSIRHISPHILSDKLQFVVSSKVGAIRSQRQTKVCRTPSLTRTLTASQLFGLRNLIRDRSQLF